VLIAPTAAVITAFVISSDCALSYLLFSGGVATFRDVGMILAYKLVPSYRKYMIVELVLELALELVLELEA
jgi:hypothetical protein